MSEKPLLKVAYRKYVSAQSFYFVDKLMMFKNYLLVVVQNFCNIVY
jgi:hypothetical protein